VAREHALIAGTGRAGTSFLVQFLAECGVPTHPLGELGYFPAARAGFEQNLLDHNAGYLVKDPWFSEYLHEIDLNEIQLDAVIIPVRDLAEAAMSRIRLERSSLYGATDVEPGRQISGGAPGGALYSLNLADQERILAVGFARVLSWCLEKSVPLYMLHFPRLVTDADYTIGTLWPWLQRFCTRERAHEVFTGLSAHQDWVSTVKRDAALEVPQQELALQIEALRTTVQQLKIAQHNGAEQIEQLHRVVAGRDAQIEHLHREVAGRDAQIAHLHREVAARDSVVADLNDVIGESKIHADEMALAVHARDAHIADLSSEVQRAHDECVTLKATVAKQRRINAQLTSSKAFRVGMFLTWPARHLRSALAALTRRD
jgi:hypothetical protein